MSKPKKSVVTWLSDAFGISHKIISESLSAEQYAKFLEEAGAVQSSVESDETDEDDEDEDLEDENETPDPKNADPKGSTVEARLSALEKGLATAKNALKSEAKAHKATTAKLTETEQKLKLAEDQKGKLRQAVNPLADEDATTSAKDGEFLTQADIDARESYNRRKAEE
ncbi:hypothetical protein [Dyadobacter diqingensis]|uniref:hypothetical protein n=1 Tax=Dyadobacter diqingensis TaxID=2938121 RepID=UPI0020C1BA40|nr:hypothetical protein [Dyadobacter diqingensis]